MKLTANQENVLKCLTYDFLQLQDICKKYALLMNSIDKKLNPSGNAWKNEVSRCLNSLIKKDLVIYGKRGFYAKGSDNLIIVTSFSCDDGHLNAFRLKDKDLLIAKIKDECKEVGEDWLNDYDIKLSWFKENDSNDKFIFLCKSIMQRGKFELIENR